MTNIGKLGEIIVAQWLESQGYHIHCDRWRCPWGEIDLIAQDKTEQSLVFVEVKTRKFSNWDNNGIFAVNLTKQQKLAKTAECFLSANPSLADFPCRFDIALVNYFNNGNNSKLLSNITHLSLLKDKPIFAVEGYQLIIQDYLQGAFDISSLVMNDEL